MNLQIVRHQPTTNSIDFESVKILVRSEQIDKTKDKNMIIGDPRPVAPRGQIEKVEPSSSSTQIAGQEPTVRPPIEVGQTTTTPREADETTRQRNFFRESANKKEESFEPEEAKVTWKQKELAEERGWLAPMLILSSSSRISK